MKNKWNRFFTSIGGLELSEIFFKEAYMKKYIPTRKLSWIKRMNLFALIANKIKIIKNLFVNALIAAVNIVIIMFRNLA